MDPLLRLALQMRRQAAAQARGAEQPSTTEILNGPAHVSTVSTANALGDTFTRTSPTALPQSARPALPPLTLHIDDCIHKLLCCVDPQALDKLGALLDLRTPAMLASPVFRRVLDRWREAPLTRPIYGDLQRTYQWTPMAALVRELARHADAQGNVDLQRFFSELGDGWTPVEGWLLAIMNGPTAPPISTYQVVLEARIGCLNANLPDITASYLAKHWGIVTQLPALDDIGQHVAKDAFDDFVIVAAQHGLGTQPALFKKFIEHGATPGDVFVAPVPYSHDPLALETLRDLGISGLNASLLSEDIDLTKDKLASLGEAMRSRNVREQADAIEAFTRAPRSPATTPYQLGSYEEAREVELRKIAAMAVAQARKTGKKLLLIDDGGLLNKIIHRDYPDMVQRTRAVEQTTRGITELSRIELAIPTMNVAQSSKKGEEAPIIARALLRGLGELLPDIGIDTFKDLPICLVGYGTVGAATAELCRALGMRVTVVEKDDARREAARAAGFEVAATIKEGAAHAKVLMGLTGHRAIPREELTDLPDGIMVASGSSAEIEIDVDFLATQRAPGHVASNTPWHLTQSAMTDADGIRTFMVNGRTLHLARGGRPLNFSRGHENVRPEEIQWTRVLMFWAAAQAAQLEDGAEAKLYDTESPHVDAVCDKIKQSWETNPPPPITITPKARPQWEAWQQAGGTLSVLADAQRGSFHDLFDEAPSVWPKSAQDRARAWGAFLESPSGELVVWPSRVGSFGGPVQALPIRGRPVWAESLGSAPATVDVPRVGLTSATRLQFIVWTELDGEVTAHHVELEPFSHLEDATRDASKARVIASYPNASLVSAFTEDARGALVTTEPRPDSREVHRKTVLLRSGDDLVCVSAQQGHLSAHTLATDRTQGRFSIRDAPLTLTLLRGAVENSLALPKELARIEHVEEAGDEVLVIGRRADGSRMTARVSETQVEVLDELPEGQLRGVTRNARGWVINLRAPGALDEPKAWARHVVSDI